MLNPFEDIMLVYSYFPFTTPGISYCPFRIAIFAKPFSQPMYSYETSFI